MATLYLNGYRDTGTASNLTATSWQFAKDKEFTKIIDESIEDTTNLRSWSSKLPKLDEDKVDPDKEEYYSDLKELWGRVKIHVGDYESDWVIIGPQDQTKQYVKVKYEDGDKVVTSKVLGWTNSEFKKTDKDIPGPQPEVKKK